MSGNEKPARPEKLTPEQEEVQRLRLEAAVLDLKSYNLRWGLRAEKLKYVMQRSWNNTCAVDGGVHFFWNPEFLSTLSDKQLNFVVVHELFHVQHKHPWRGGVYIDQLPEDIPEEDKIASRQAKSKNIARWGVAVDLAVHASLVPQSEHQYRDWMEFSKDWLYDPAFAGCAAETIYQYLVDVKDQHETMQGRGPGAIILIGQGKAPQGAKQLPNGQYVVVYDQDGNQVDVQNDSVLGGMTEEEFQDVLDKVNQEASRQESQGYGDTPGNRNRSLEIIQTPYRVDWRQLLHRFMAGSSRTDYSWTRPNRRSAGLGVILPGLDAPKVTGVIAIDTSGSIDEDLLQIFGQEVQNIRSQVPFHELTIVYCDAGIQGREIITQGESLVFNPKGGGGTDFCPVFNLFRDQHYQPNFLVYFTDLDGRFPPDPPPYPVLWGVYNTSRKAPFGETVSLAS